MNQLIKEIVQDFERKKVEFIPSQVDSSFKIDLYWFNICLKNLIEKYLAIELSDLTVDRRLDKMCIVQLNYQLLQITK